MVSEVRGDSGDLTQVGEYKLVSKLDQQQYVDVYFGLHSQVERVAVVKLFPIKRLPASAREEFRAAFRRGAEAAQTLVHPRIVTLYDWGEENEVLYRAEEFLSGKLLSDLISERGLLPASDSISIAKQLCEALLFAHGHGVVHGCLHPMNIHVLDDRVAKISDFGVPQTAVVPEPDSRPMEDPTGVLSPEQLDHAAPDARSDVFSVAAILHQLITGELPYTPGEPARALSSPLNERIPAELAPVLTKALATNPRERFQKCQEFYTELMALHVGDSGTRAGSAAKPAVIPDRELIGGKGLAEGGELESEPAPIRAAVAEQSQAQLPRQSERAPADEQIGRGQQLLEPGRVSGLPPAGDPFQTSKTPSKERPKVEDSEGPPQDRRDVKDVSGKRPESRESLLEQLIGEQLDRIWLNADAAVKSITLAAEETLGQLREAQGGLEASLRENQEKRLAAFSASLEGLEERSEALTKDFEGRLARVMEGIQEKSAEEARERLRKVNEELLERSSQQFQERTEGVRQGLEAAVKSITLAAEETLSQLREAQGGLEASLRENQEKRLAAFSASLEGFGEKLHALADGHARETADQIAQMTKGALESLSKTTDEIHDQFRRTAAGRMSREVEALEAHYQQALQEQRSAAQKQIYEIVNVAIEEGRGELHKALKEFLAREFHNASALHDEPWSPGKRGSLIKGSVPAINEYESLDDQFQTSRTPKRALTIPKFALTALLCFIAMIPPTIGIILSVQPAMRLRIDPPPDFIDRGPNWSAERLEREEELAHGYWQLAVGIVQEKYEYGKDLPEEPPADFQLAEDSSDKRVRPDRDSRERYWDRLRQAWGRRGSWKRVYEWNTEWIYRLLPYLRD